MKPDTDPKKIQRKLNLSFFEDGLWDAVLGLFLLGWGLTVWLDLAWVPSATFAAFFWLALGLKQKITYPRVGYAKPLHQRRQLWGMLIAGIAALLLGLLVFLMVTNRAAPQFVHDYFDFLFEAMIAIAVGLIGYWWTIKRWLAYAVLLVAFAASTQWLGLAFELSFAIPGAVVFCCALFVIVRFLRKYRPIPAEEFNGR